MVIVRFWVGAFRTVDFLVGVGVFRGGDGLPRGRAFLGTRSNVVPAPEPLLQ